MNIKRLIESERFSNAVYKYLAGLFIYGVGIFIFGHFPYYKLNLNPQAIVALKYLYYSYIVLGLPICYLVKEKDSKPLELLLILNKAPDLIREYSYYFLKKGEKFTGLTEREKTVLRFSLVKFFYIPLMISFTFINFDSIKASLSRDSLRLIFSDFGSHYTIITQVFFAIDTVIFCFGYIFESKYLKNTLRSVDPSVLGWMAALATYPPFNGPTTSYLGWYSQDNFVIPVTWIDTISKILIIVCVGIYLWATLSLGTKASNLTNRGIVTYGAYRWVRHPAYISKVLSWWIMILPSFSIQGFFSMVGWTAVYYLRAITEERHLIADPDYQKYVKKTQYRFIPGII